MLQQSLSLEQRRALALASARRRQAESAPAITPQNDTRARTQGMIPTDDPGSNGFVTQAQFDDERTQSREAGDLRRTRAARVRSDFGDLIRDPGGYVASRALGTVERSLRQPMSDLNPARAFAEAAPAGQLYTQGATLGYGDELMGGAAALGSAVSGGDAGQSYRSNTDGARAEMRANREAAPVTAMAAEGLGGLAMMPVMPGASFAAGAETRLGMAGRGAVVGGAYGTAVGSGEAEGGLANRAIGAAIGAPLGATLGAAAPIVIEGVVRGGRGALRLLSRAINSRSQGRELTGSQLTRWNTLLDEAESAGWTEQQILERYNELRATGLSAEETTGELLGPAALERMRGGVATGNRDALQGRDAVNRRQAQQPARVRSSLRDNLGSDGGDFTTTRDSLARPTPRETALYGEFENQPGVARAADIVRGPDGSPVRVYHGTASGFDEFSDAARGGVTRANSARLESFFQNRRFARIAQRAAEDIAPDGAPIDVQNGEITPELFDAIKKRIDRMVNDATSGATRDTTRARPLEQLQERFVAFADEVFPNYAPARAEAQVRLSQREALQMGRDIFNARNTRTPEDVAAGVERMTPEQLQRFRQGVARGVSDRMNMSPTQAIEVNGNVVSASSADATNPISRFFNRSDHIEALRAAFGDEANFERFVRRMMIERDRAANFPRISPRTAGSPTDANQAARAVSNGAQAVADVAEVASNPWGAGLRKIINLVGGRKPNPETERQIQRIIWSTVDEQRPALLAALRERGIITAGNANALLAARQASTPAVNALLQSTQN
jgi:hypothetical protein